MIFKMSHLQEGLCSPSDPKLSEVLVTVTFAGRWNDQYDDILSLMISWTDELLIFSNYSSFIWWSWEVGEVVKFTDPPANFPVHSE